MLYLMQEYKDELLPNIAVKIWKKNDFTIIFRYGTGKHTIADIVLGSSKSGKKYLSLQLFPPNFKEGNFERFKKDLSVIIPELTYEFLYFNGRVAYIELARDCLSLDRKNIIPYRSHTRSSNVYIEKATGYRGTITLGSEASREKCRIYAKNRQLKNTGKDNYGYAKFAHRTRIETASRHIGLSPSEVAAKMENRFAKVECFDLTACRAYSDDAGWQSLLDICETDGSATALKLVPTQRKQKFLAMMRTCAVPHCDLASAWAELPKAMEIVAP